MNATKENLVLQTPIDIKHEKKITSPIYNRSPLTKKHEEMNKDKCAGICKSKERLSMKQEKNRKKDKPREGDAITRRMLDKRTARLRFADDFKNNIEEHLQLKNQREIPMVHNIVNHQENISVFVRKRPLFQHELKRGEFDVVRLILPTSITVENCVMLPDMKNMQIKPSTYPCTLSFDENCSDDMVYTKTASPLLHHVIQNGANAAVLMYGPTGSGKSYTMSGIQKRLSCELFQLLSHDNSAEVRLICVELTGKKCKDLLLSSKKAVSCSDIKIVDADVKSCQPAIIMNANSIKVSSSSEFMQVINQANKRRATANTEKNGVSSRSHAIYHVEISHLTTSQESLKKTIVLDLIDLAGTERRNDSLFHSLERQKESTEINETLFKLKECIRAKVSGSHVPYRSHFLTRLLRGHFEDKNSKFSLIATVAPNTSDTEHTMDTLKTASSFMGAEQMIKEGISRDVIPVKKQIAHTHPKQWNHTQLLTWLKKMGYYDLCSKPLDDDLDGKKFLKWNLSLLRTKLCNGNNELSLSIFKALRNECDRISKLQLKHRLLSKK